MIFWCLDVRKSTTTVPPPVRTTDGGVTTCDCADDAIRLQHCSGVEYVYGSRVLRRAPEAYLRRRISRRAGRVAAHTSSPYGCYRYRVAFNVDGRNRVETVQDVTWSVTRTENVVTTLRLYSVCESAVQGQI